nr:MAG TPA: hypothetical protein [Caudoviricetes sp.]
MRLHFKQGRLCRGSIPRLAFTQKGFLLLRRIYKK